MSPTASVLAERLARFSKGKPQGGGAPDKAEAAWREGVAHQKARRHSEALECFKRAVKLAPHDSVYWLNISTTCLKLHLPDQAFEAAHKAHELDPRSQLAAQLMARMYRDRSMHQEALDVLRSLPADVSLDATHHVLIGASLADLGRPVEASQSYLEALSIKPDLEEAHMQLGFNLAKMRRHADAAECFRTVLAFRPHALECALYAMHYAAWACSWDQVDADRNVVADCMDRVGEGADVGAISPFCLLSITDDGALMRAVTEWDMRRFAPLPRPMVEQAWPREPGRRLRVGMVSCDFHHHATSMLMVELLEKMDRSQVELVLFSHGIDDESALRARVKAAADDFIDCRGMSSRAQAERIHSERIDVLIDLKGYTQDTRISVFSYRPAPVQVAWLGYPGTCGAPFIDYVIGDPVVTPLAHQPQYTECIAQLPVCYQPNDQTRGRSTERTRESCGLPADKVVFASFNQSYKITREMFALWCRVLNRVPDSVLWMLVPDEPVRERLLAEAAARGVAPERLIFATFEKIERHRQRIVLADVHLDTFPCGGHTTCSDALWGGVPTVVLEGQSFASRVAPSLLNALGLSELTVTDEQAYEDLAVRLGTDSAYRQRLRTHLEQARDTSALYDSARLSRDLIALLERMWTRAAQGLPPEPLPASAVADEPPHSP
jgi:predicted O-linked N-acetylglucosamine transferase (SPINDLY family)